MKCTSISFLDSFYRSAYGDSLSTKVSMQLLHDDEIFRGNIIAYGFGWPYLDKINNSNLYFAIPESYPVYRWPQVRPFKTVIIDAKAQPFKSAAFDTAIAFHVVEFCNDLPNKFLAEIRRVLKPNGILIVIAINIYGVNSIFHIKKDIRYSINELSDILEDSQFKVINITGKNGRLKLWTENIGYFITKCTDLFISKFSSLADVVIIKAQKTIFASEQIEVFVPQYEI